MHAAFPKHTIINRGFGGSSLTDVIAYADDLIFSYAPKQIVVYCGENDLASSDTVTAAMVFQRFAKLFTLIRSRLPNVPVVYVSMKPSPARWALKEKMQQGNKLIKMFLKKQKRTAYVDVWPAMLNAKGLPREELFGPDKLHMNEAGYRIWTRLIEPKLKM